MRNKFILFPILVWICAMVVLYCAFFLPTELILKTDSNALKHLEVESIWKDGRAKRTSFEFYTPLDLPQEQRLAIKRLFPDRLILKAFPQSAESSIRSAEVIRFGVIRRTFRNTMDLSCSGGSLFISVPICFLLLLLIGGGIGHIYLESRYHWLERLYRERRGLFLTFAFLFAYFFFTNLLMYYQNPGDDWKFQCLGAYGFSELPEVISTCLPSLINRNEISGWERAIRSTTPCTALPSVTSFFRNFILAGTLKKISLTTTVVPFGQPASARLISSPPLIS